MIRYPKIAAELYESPWMMWPGRYREVCVAFERARRGELRQAADDPVGPEGEDFFTGEKRPLHPQVEMLEGTGVAVTAVHGITGKGLSRLAMQCGGFDTGLFREQMRNVAEDGRVKVLVVDFDSPGGMVIGTRQAADALRAVSESGKRVIGFTGKQCCSAAYWMAAACDEFHAEVDAVVGSISTIWSGVDSSRAWEKEGKELKLFATGKFKATGMAGKRWTEEEEKMIWARLEGLDKEFKDYVRARRGLRDEDMEGQWWYAGRAPQGVVDSTDFESLDEVLEAAVVLAGRG